MALAVAVNSSLTFDARRLRRLGDKMRSRCLGRVGALLRRVAQRSLRYRDRPAKPGEPPSVHRRGSFTRSFKRKSGEVVTRATSPLRELLLFAVDGRGDSVVAGPAIFQQRRTKAYKVPSVLEAGGVIYRRAAGRPAKAIRIEPRPTMGPALEKTRDKFTGLFKNQFGK